MAGFEVTTNGRIRVTTEAPSCGVFLDRDLIQEKVKGIMRIPDEADQRSGMMSITIPG
jgi:hypothetical protein